MESFTAIQNQQYKTRRRTQVAPREALANVSHKD
jgi:hypothetical protein